jgi:predicted deacylase
VVQEREDEREIYENSLSAYFISKNVPSITVEGGPDKLILKKHIDQVFEGLLRILENQKMIDRPKYSKDTNKTLKDKIFNNKKLLSNGETIRVSASGNLKYLVEPGGQVKHGQVVAKLYDEFGDKLKDVVAPHDAFVLGHSEKISVVAGDEIFWLAKN